MNHPHVHRSMHRGRPIQFLRAPGAIATWRPVERFALLAWPDMPQGCTPDVSNARAVDIARSISKSDSPITWIDRGEYATNLDGVIFLFVMWQSAPGRRDVSIFNCGPVRDLAAGLMGTPYSANMECPCPPVEAGWTVVNPALAEAYDLTFQARAADLLQTLPLWTTRDEVLSSGLYRWFCFEAACGRSVGALKYVGAGASGTARSSTAGTMGAPDDCPEGYIMINGVCIPPDAPNPKNWQSPVAPPPDRPAGEEGGETGAITDTPHDAPRASNGAPLWQPDETCDGWTPDASNPKADKLANDILWNPPRGKRGSGAVPPWVDGTTYHTVIDGVPWKFPMYSAGGLQYVSALRCSSPKKKAPTKPPALSISSSALWIILAMIGVVGGGSLLAHYSKKRAA